MLLPDSPTLLYRLDQDPPTVEIARIRADTAPIPIRTAARKQTRRDARTRRAEQIVGWILAILGLAFLDVLLILAVYCTPWGWEQVNP